MRPPSDERPRAGLDEVRAEIDAIDDAILDLLEKRADKALEAARIKEAEGRASLHDPEREQQILARISAPRGRVLPASAVREVFEAIIRACRALQHPRRR